MTIETKDKTVETKNETVPTLAHVLSTLAYHISEIMTNKPTRSNAPYCERARFGLGLGNYGEGCPSVLIEVVIKPTDTEGWIDRTDSWDVWAQVYTRTISERVDEEPNVLDGSWASHGNRCGGREAYARMVAPVIEWVACYWANKAHQEALKKDLQRYSNKCKHESTYCNDRMETVCHICGEDLGR